MAQELNDIAIPAGRLQYVDTGGDKPVLVLLPGLFMDHTLWSAVVDRLRADFRCIVPITPMGAHRLPLGPAADLSLRGIARMVVDLVAALGLHDVTIVGNDTGGAIAQLVAAQGDPAVARLVLVSCDAFDNLPPGLTGKTLVATGLLPPAAFGGFMQQMRLRAVRRLPIAFGWLTKRGDAVSAGWVQPVLQQAGVRRDMVRLLRSIARDRRVLLDEQPRIAAFPGPVLIVWAAEDRVMPPAHAYRLQQLFQRADVVMVRDSYTLIPLDQPDRLAQAIATWPEGAAA